MSLMKEQPIEEILIFRDRPSAWTSCRSITSNLRRSYELKNSQGLIEQPIPIESGAYDFYKLAKKIIQSNPKRIIWIDHSPHPKEFIKALRYLYSFLDLSFPELHFHLFGDVTLELDKWKSCEEDLKLFAVRFYCASDRQKKLIDQFFDSQNIVHPFGVDEQNYYFCQKQRDKFREYFQIEKNAKVFTYTGRISVQKNVIELVQIYKSLSSQNTEQKTYLFLAGPIDDLGIPYIGMRGILGSFAQLWKKEIGPLKVGEFDDGVIYIGNLNSQGLHQLYCGSDHFFSLSTHNDEDFGMSPAEALMSGLSCSLADWGGYSSFPRYVGKESCQSIPVEMGKKRVLPKSSIAQKQFLRALFKENMSAQQRKALSEKAHSELGIKATARKLEKSLELKTPVFSQFRPVMTKFISSFVMSPEAPFRSQDGSYSQFYREVYSVYGSET